MEDYNKLLQTAGLSTKESAVYLALLELGEADVTDIARQAKTKRPTTYFVLEDLIQKGLVYPTGGKIQKYQAEKPQKVVAAQREKFLQLEQALPGLIGLSKKSNFKPSVRFLSGIEGIKSIYEESLLQAPGSEMLAMGNAKAVEESIKGFGEWYITRRVAGKIRMRALVTESEYAEIIIKRDKLELRQTRTLATDLFTQDVEINIYGNTVTMVSFQKDEVVGVIIESSVFASGFRQMFELLWSMTKSK